MQIGEFTLVNAEKYDRVINGSVGAEGRLYGGIGKDASEEAILAEYDKLGGLILKGKYTVKTGSFYDFSKKVARKEPVVTFVFRDVQGNEVEVAEDEPIPLEVKAAQVAISKKKTKKQKLDEE